VTDASVHDSQALDDLLNASDAGQDLYADSAYTGENQEKTNGLFIRSVGIARATGIIGLINLTYNLFRYEQIIRLA